MKFRAYLYACAGLVWATLPVIAQAALVPCGLSSDPNVAGSLSCDLCYAGQLLQNLVNYAIGLSIPLAAGLFAWAGLLYMSSRGNPARIADAHKIFRSVVIGFVLALGAWFIVQTFLQVLFKQDYFKDLGGGWTSLNCEEQRKAREQTTNKKISDVLSSNLPNTIRGGLAVGGGVTGSTGITCNANTQICTDINGIELNRDENISCDPNRGCWNNITGERIGTESGCGAGGTLTAENFCVRDDGAVYAAGAPITSSGSSGSCPAPYVYVASEGGYCQNPNNDNDWIEAYEPGARGSDQPIPVGKGTRGTAMCTEYNPYCSLSSLQGEGLSEAEARTMSCIAITESGGAPALCSGTGPCGVYQITKTNWKAYAPAGCTAADFGGNIEAAQNNGECNRRVAAAMVQEEGYEPWTGLCNTPGGCNVGTRHEIAYGQPWNAAARKCVSNYDPSNL